MALITVHAQAFKLYKEHLIEYKVLPEHRVNKLISSVVFLITFTVLAPLVSIPLLFGKWDFVAGYSKALILTAKG